MQMQRVTSNARQAQLMHCILLRLPPPNRPLICLASSLLPRTHSHLTSYHQWVSPENNCASNQPAQGRPQPRQLVLSNQPSWAKVPWRCSELAATYLAG